MPVKTGDFPSIKWKKHLGSWGHAIKKIGKAGDPAWDQDDIPSTVEALQKTGQNVYIYPACSTTDYEHLLELLSEPTLGDISVYADIGFALSTTNIWFTVYG